MNKGLISVSVVIFFLFSHQCFQLYGSKAVNPITGTGADSLLSAKVILLKERLTSSKYDSETEKLYNQILVNLRSGLPALPVIASDAYYYTGVYNQNARINRPDTALVLYTKALEIRKMAKTEDEIYSKALGNIGLIYLDKGDPVLGIDFLSEGLKVRQCIFGQESVETISPIINLVAVYIEANKFDQAIETALLGIKIVNNNLSQRLHKNLVVLYINAGTGYVKLKNYSIAEDYLKVAYNLYNEYNLSDTELLLKILNALAVTCNEAGKFSESMMFYERAVSSIKDSELSKSDIAVPIFSNYGYLLAKLDDQEKAEYYINRAVLMAEESAGASSLAYQSELENFAYYLAIYKGDIERSLALYNGFYDFIEKNPWNRDFSNTVNYGYAQALTLEGRNREALERISMVLDDANIVSDKTRLISLVLKREILNELYLSGGSVDYIRDAFGAISEAVDLYDQIRNDISSEDSQLKAGSRYNYVYEDCISTLFQLYDATGEDQYRELSFYYAEKAKASSLLASTRQSRAMKFHIPEELAAMEQKLEKEIMSYSELLFNERSARYPDSAKIVRYENLKLSAIMKDDSLKRVFEEDYPKYNALKSNTLAAGYMDVRKSIGRKNNFIEYYVADTTLYIYLVNNREFEMYAVPYSMELQQNIRELRNIVINPAIDKGARSQYSDYTRLSYDIYQSVFKPVESSLVSERLVIAPDDLLSYIPFEALLTGEVNDSSINYRKLPFLVNSYDIVYAYSGTLMTETGKGGRNFINPALTFAPEYRGDIYVDSVMRARQISGAILENIPGAREEAISVNELLGGELFLDSESTESKFKECAADGRIIHLAMHTLLNDESPMYSKMVFDLNDDGPNDGKLNTYEIYDIPLSAKMVVLSSCNTGSGYLQSGEGVMSLARGFFYSGSPTVVMSLWEVDDRSGSQIIKQFYRNLKKGSSKSNALRKARVKYLAEAEQMRSHPYFWCTLVIMGDDSPLFYSKARISMVGLLLILSLAWIIYRQRFISS